MQMKKYEQAKHCKAKGCSKLIRIQNKSGYCNYCCRKKKLMEYKLDRINIMEREKALLRKMLREFDK